MKNEKFLGGTGRFVATALIIATGAFTAEAATIQELLLNPHKLKGCSEITGEHAVSVEASTHYASAEDVPTAGAPVWSKRYQSFECDGAASTIYYYQYPTQIDVERAQSAIEALIWNGAEPTAEHPELIFAVDNVLVVVSSENPKYFKKQILKSARSH